MGQPAPTCTRLKGSPFREIRIRELEEDAPTPLAVPLKRRAGEALDECEDDYPYPLRLVAVYEGNDVGTS